MTPTTETPQRPASFPPQHQNNQPGIEMNMNPRPEAESPVYKPAGKLTGKGVAASGPSVSVRLYRSWEGHPALDLRGGCGD